MKVLKAISKELKSFSGFFKKYYAKPLRPVIFQKAILLQRTRGTSKNQKFVFSFARKRCRSLQHHNLCTKDETNSEK